MATAGPVKPVSIQIDSSPLNVITLRRVTLDCSDMFVEVEGEGGAKTYLLRHTKTTKVLRLSWLDPLRTTTEGHHEFLPDKIYVRDCMQEIFNKIVQANDITKYAVVFGSPGVGKSVLSFLASLCCVYFIKKPILFLRKTTKKKELISLFLITLSDGKLTVQFDRGVKRDNKLRDVHARMMERIFADDIRAGNIDKARNPSPYLRQMCDGPRHGHGDHVGDSDLVTSGGYKTPKDEASTEINSLPLSAWTQKEVVQACRHLFNVKAIRAKEIFDVCGGNICKIAAVLEQSVSLVEQREYIDDVFKKDGSKEKLHLAYEFTSMSGTEHSIDRLRAMFAKSRASGSYTTVQYIGAPYLLRLIRSELSMEETLKGLQFAKQSGIQSLYGWHFELFGHKVFQVSHKRQVETTSQDNLRASPEYHPFTIEEGRGSGKESVNQLKTCNVYWTPSTSNFANIDAAIGLNGILYCIQYTVSFQHTFNCHTFMDFLEELPPEFRQNHPKAIVIFVVPANVMFRRVVIPKSQESLKSGITCGGDIKLTFRRARSASKGTEDEEMGDDGENKMDEGGGDEHEADETTMEEANGNADKDGMDDEESDDDDEHNSDEKSEGKDMEDGFSDEDCGEEEGFDGTEIGHMQQNSTLCVHFQWEVLGEDFDVEKAPLSFLNLPSDSAGNATS